MRFEVQKSTKRSIECFERLGVLYHEKETNNKTFTPTCTLYTSSGNFNIVYYSTCFIFKVKNFSLKGCVPHVSNDLLKYISHVPNLVEVPLPTM